MKKQQLNHQVYHLHLLLTNSWGNSWPYIKRSIEEKLEKTLRQKYKQLDYKLEKLTQSQINPKELHSFYLRVINKTNIIFTDNEVNLLEKGPK